MKLLYVLITLLIMIPAAKACNPTQLKDAAYQQVIQKSQSANSFEMSTPGGTEKLPLAVAFNILIGGQEIRMIDFYQVLEDCTLQRLGNSSLDQYQHVDRSDPNTPTFDGNPSLLPPPPLFPAKQ